MSGSGAGSALATPTSARGGAGSAGPAASAFARVVQDKGAKHVRKLFKSYDREANGRVRAADLGRILRSMGLRMTAQEVIQLRNACECADDARMVNYEALLGASGTPSNGDAAHPRHRNVSIVVGSSPVQRAGADAASVLSSGSGAGSHAHAHDTGAPDEPSDWRPLIHWLSARQKVPLRAQLRSMDTAKSGALPRAAVRSTLDQLGVSLSDKQFGELLANAGADAGDDEVEYNALVDSIDATGATRGVPGGGVAATASAAAGGARAAGATTKRADFDIVGHISTSSLSNRASSNASDRVRYVSQQLANPRSGRMLEHLSQDLYKMSVDSSGAVARDAFCKRLAQEHNLTPEDVETIANQFETNDGEGVRVPALQRFIEATLSLSGTNASIASSRKRLEQGTFIDVVTGRRMDVAPGSSEAAARVSRKHSDLREERALLDRIRDRLQYRRSQFRRVFQDFDENHDGVVSHDELRRGLENLGLAVSERELELLLTRCDPTNSGAMSYAALAGVLVQDDFGTAVDEIKEVSDQGSSALTRQDRSLLVDIGNKAAQRGVSLFRLLSMTDKKRNGVVDCDALVGQLQSIGVNVNRHDLTMLAAHVGAYVDGNSTRDQPAIAYRTLSKAISSWTGELSESGLRDTAVSDESSARARERHDAVATVAALVGVGDAAAPAALPGNVASSAVRRFVERIAPHARELQRQLRRMDRNKDGMITLSELKHALTQLHVEVGDDDWREFVALANDARAGAQPSNGAHESQVVDADTIPYTAFCERLLSAVQGQGQAESPSSTARALPQAASSEAAQWTEGSRQLVDRIRTALGPRRGRALRHLFERFADSGRRALQPHELRYGLLASGVALSNDELPVIMDLVDPGRTGLVTLDAVQRMLEGAEHSSAAEHAPATPQAQHEVGTRSLAAPDAGQEAFTAYRAAVASLSQTDSSTTAGTPRSGPGAAGGAAARLETVTQTPLKLGGAEDAGRETLRRVAHALAANRNAVRRACSRVDRDGDGCITGAELGRVLSRLNVTLNDGDLDVLLHACGARHASSYVNYDELLVAFSTPRSSAIGTPRSAGTSSSLFGDDGVARDAIVDGILAARAGSSAGTDASPLTQLCATLRSQAKSPAQAFHSIDTLHRGAVSVAELRRGIQQMGLAMGGDEFASLCSEIGTRTDGSIAMDDFERAVARRMQELPAQRRVVLPAGGMPMLVANPTPVANPFQLDQDRAIVARVVDGVGGHRASTLGTSLSRMDRDEDGYVTYSEVKTALANMKVTLTEHEFRRFVSYADPQLVGLVSIGRLVGMLRSGGADHARALPRADGGDGDASPTAHRIHSSTTTTVANANLSSVQNLFGGPSDASAGTPTSLRNAPARGDGEQDPYAAAPRSRRSSSAPSTRHVTGSAFVAVHTQSVADRRDRLETGLRAALGDRPATLRRTMQRLDPSRSGSVSHSDLIRVLAQYGQRLEPSEFESLVQRVDPSRTGLVDIDATVTYLTGTAVGSSAAATPRQAAASGPATHAHAQQPQSSLTPTGRLLAQMHQMASRRSSMLDDRERAFRESRRDVSMAAALTGALSADRVRRMSSAAASGYASAVSRD